MVWSWILLLQDKFEEKEKENIKLTEEIDQVKKQSKNLQSTIEQQQKETDHLKVRGAELHDILYFNQPCNNTAEMWASVWDKHFPIHLYLMKLLMFRITVLILLFVHFSVLLIFLMHVYQPRRPQTMLKHASQLVSLIINHFGL